jgi:hypothetical protein
MTGFYLTLTNKITENISLQRQVTDLVIGNNHFKMFSPNVTDDISSPNSISFWGAVLGFELRALCLLGRHCTI